MKTVALINLKGGVAKTTTTVGLAAFLSGVFGKKVLVIDIDPQTNCTTMLIGENRWKDLNSQGLTLHALFSEALKGGNNFDISKIIQKNVSGIKDVKTVHLIPSSLDMIDIQDKIATIPQGQFFAGSPVEVLKRAIWKTISNYDYVLIDCPPNMGLITLNALRISDGYIIPAIPDVLSTYGIPQIINRVSQFSNTIAQNIECLGIVATKVRTQSSLHMRTLDELKKEKDAPLFETIFNENSGISESAVYRRVNTLRQRFGYGGQYEVFEAFASEFMVKAK